MSQESLRGRRYRILAHERRDPAAVLAEREARRRRVLRDLVATATPEELSHQWLAERSGIPVRYLRWRYATIEQLVQDVSARPA